MPTAIALQAAQDKQSYVEEWRLLKTRRATYCGKVLGHWQVLVNASNRSTGFHRPHGLHA